MTEPHPVTEYLKAMYAADDSHPACLHCDADSALIEVSPGLLILEIRHDDACPELARHQHRPPGCGFARLAR